MSPEERSTEAGGRARLHTNLRYVSRELCRHLPFSVFSVAAGIVVLAVLTFVIQSLGGSVTGGGAGESVAEHAPEGHHQAVFATPAGALFHVFHPVHLLFSAVATTAMFWRYERRLLKAVVTGLIGSVGICSLSDIVFPYVGGLFLGARMGFHVCIVEHPGLVLPFVFVGIGVGLLAAETIRTTTFISHSAHVFVSTMASILYLVAFGLADWPEHLGGVFLVSVVAVLVPCCTSDIVFPLLVVTGDGVPPAHAHTH